MFVWTFPLYILGGRPTVSPAGEISISKETPVLTAEGPLGQHLLIFTDGELSPTISPSTVIGTWKCLSIHLKRPRRSYDSYAMHQRVFRVF